MIKAIFFDAIDTLFEAYPDKIHLYQNIIEKHTGIRYDLNTIKEKWDLAVLEAEKAATLECGDNILAWKNFNADLLEKLGFQGDVKKVGAELKNESWDNPENYRLYEDVTPAIQELKARGIRLACVSNEDDSLNNFFVHFGIHDYFEKIISSEEIGCEKPNPKIFELALKTMELKPNEVVFVGDSLISDYEGSLKAGLKPVLIDRGNKISDNNICKINKLTELVSVLEGENKYACTTA